MAPKDHNNSTVTKGEAEDAKEDKLKGGTQLRRLIASMTNTQGQLLCRAAR